jgi:hypothetical protein
MATEMATPPDLDAALRDLLWIAAWQAGEIRARTAPDLADRHETLLAEVTKLVRDHREDPALKAKRSPVHATDELLLHVHDGITSVFREASATAAKAAAQQDASFVDRIAAWLEQWSTATHTANFDRATLTHAMRPSPPAASVGEWVREQRGPVEAGATLLEDLGVVGRTRLLELRSAYRADAWKEEGIDLLGVDQRARYGGTGLRSDEVRRYAMKLLGFAPEVIDAALASQPTALDLDFVPGGWLP